MKNISTLGKQLSKAEQKSITGGETSLVGNLYCGPFGGPYTDLGQHGDCGAELDLYCYDDGPYEHCYCTGRGGENRICDL